MPRDECRVYVGNLPPDTRTKDIEDVFYKYGKILHVDLKERGREPGFAFIKFDDPRDAEDAVDKRDGYDFDGYKLRVEFPRGEKRQRFGFGGGRDGGGRGGRDGGGRGRGGPARRSQYRVLVSELSQVVSEEEAFRLLISTLEWVSCINSGLPKSGSWQDLKDFMREAGDACYANVNKDGSGVVEFQRYDDMKYAVKKLNDSKFRSRDGETSYIRLKEDTGGASSSSRARSSSRGRSPSRSRSPDGRRGSPDGRRGSPDGRRGSPKRSPSRSRSRSADRR